MSRKCEALEAYMPDVQRLAAQLGTRLVYLATDDPVVIEQAQQFQEYQFMYMRILRRPADDRVLWDKRVRRAKGALDKEVQRATVDMFLLSMSDAFVGKFTSNFMRTAFSIHAASCECVPPFASLDAPWCFDYGVRAGMNVELAQRQNRSGHGTNFTFWC